MKEYKVQRSEISALKGSGKKQKDIASIPPSSAIFQITF